MSVRAASVPATAAAPEGRGLASWLLQRLTGLFLSFFVGVHIVALHFAREWYVDVRGIVARLESSSLMVAFYVLFVPAVVYHGLNGVWGVALDMGPSPGARRALAVVLWLVGIGTTAYGLRVLGALTALR